MDVLHMPADRVLDCTRFGGVTDEPHEGVGCFRRAHNLSSRCHPHLSSPAARYRIGTLPSGRIYPFAAEKLGYMTSTGRLYYDGDLVQGWSFTDTSADSHSIVMLGKRAVFFPEKAWFDTESGECGSLGISKSSSSAVVSIDFDDGVAPADYFYTLAEPTDPKNNTLWVRKDYSDDSFVCYRWYSATDEWVRQERLLYRVAFDFAGDGVNEGDRLEVTECASEETGFEGFLGMHRVRSATSGLIEFESTPERKLLPRICRDVSHNILLKCFTAERRVPDLCLVGVAGERIWGVDADGSTIRACAPGDPFSWFSFDGYGGDSFMLATSYPGRYTGIGCLDDMPVLFKSDRIIRLKGSRPDNFSLLSSAVPGLEEGCGEGVCSDGRALYYKGAGGVYRYDSGLPELLFRLDAGEVKAACDGRFCYFAGDGGFAVYDTKNKVLCTEDGGAESIFCHGGSVWYISSDGENELFRIGEGEGSGERMPERPFVLESSHFPPSEVFGACPRSLAFDIESDGKSDVCLEFSWGGEFEHIAAICFEGRLRSEIMLPHRKCSVCAYRISGTGPFILREAALFTPK